MVPEVSAVTGTQETCMQPTQDMDAAQRGHACGTERTCMWHREDSLWSICSSPRHTLSGLRKAGVSKCLLGVFK